MLDSDEFHNAKCLERPSFDLRGGSRNPFISKMELFATIVNSW